MAIKYGRGKFVAHPNYIEYMNMIADSETFSDMPNLRSEDGRINWQVSSGKGTSFYEYYDARFSWWVNKADALHLAGNGNSNDRFSIAARIIHPTKLRACRLCGIDRHIGYMYLNANTAKSWNKTLGSELFVKQEEIIHAVDSLVSILGVNQAIVFLKKEFPERKEYFSLLDANIFNQFFINSQHIRSTKLSPGFMANPPDRLDGFHDYCLYCRKKNDPGRSDENMSTYNHDRRAFMWWAEGDWKMADAIYNSASAGVCMNCGKKVRKISPDHVGPLACGFKQNGFFVPLCGKCNSSKNRRFTSENVQQLIKYELNHNESVASWQVKALWDKAKHIVCSDAEAKELSNYMRAMQDYYLRLLGFLQEHHRFSFLLSLLHPEYAYFDVSISGLDSSTFVFESVNKTENKSTGARSLAARSIRIAFEELAEYCAKPPEKRKINKAFDAFVAADASKVQILFENLRLNAEDTILESIIFAPSTSVDEKDAAIQKVIEASPFDQRVDYYSEIRVAFQQIIDERADDFFKMYCSEF